MKNLIILLAASASLLRADLVEQGPKDSRPSGLYAGVARADVTAPVGIPQMNWGSQTHITAEGSGLRVWPPDGVGPESTTT